MEYEESRVLSTIHINRENRHFIQFPPALLLRDLWRSGDRETDSFVTCIDESHVEMWKFVKVEISNLFPRLVLSLYRVNYLTYAAPTFGILPTLWPF